MRINALKPVFTEYIPADPEPGHLYLSMHFQTAVHLCACGCESKVVTPFGPNDWVLTFDGTVSLRPSVGNGQHDCRSHYYIRCDRIAWLPQISAAATQVATARDRTAHARAKTLPPTSWWKRAWGRIHRPSSRVRSQEG
jgi:hypothetical protein